MTTPTQQSTNASNVQFDLAAPSWGGVEGGASPGVAHGALRNAQRPVSILSDEGNRAVTAGAQLREKYGDSLNPANIEDLQQGERRIELGAAVREAEQMELDAEAAGDSLSASEGGVEEITQALNEGGFTPQEEAKLRAQREELERQIEQLLYLKKVLERQAAEHAAQIVSAETATRDVTQELGPQGRVYIEVLNKGVDPTGMADNSVPYSPHTPLSHRDAASAGFANVEPTPNSKETLPGLRDEVAEQQRPGRTKGQAFQEDYAKRYEQIEVTTQATGQTAPSMEAA